MAANLIATDSGGTPIQTITFLDVSPGSPSSPFAFRLFNDNGAGPVDEATEPVVILRQVNANNEGVLKDLRAIDERWIEIRAVGGGSSGSTQVATGFVAIGFNRQFQAAALPSGEFHDFELRYNPPASAQGGQIQFLLEAEPGLLATATDLGTSETWRDSILNGLGQGLYDEIAIGGDAVENPAGADDQVLEPDLVWLFDRRYWSALSSLRTFDNLDGASAPLGVAEAYIAIVSLSGGLITVTKGLKALISAPPTAPTIPTGEIPLYQVFRDDANIINDSDITQLTGVGQFFVTTSLLIATFGVGRAHVDNALQRRTITQDVNLAANDTNSVFLLSDGNMQANVTGIPPEPRAYLVGEFTTDATQVTSSRRLVDTLGGELIALRFAQAGTVTAGFVYEFPARDRDVYVRMPNGIQLLVGDLGGGGTPHTAGRIRTNVFKSDGSGGWTTLFTSFASDDRRPKLDFDQTNDLVSTAGPDGPVLPDILLIEAGRLLRIEIELPTAFDGTPTPTDLVLALNLEMS